MQNSSNNYADFNVLLEILQQGNIRFAIDSTGDLRVRSQGGIDEALIDGIRQHKTALKAWVLQQSVKITPHSSYQQIPLTSQQMRLWYVCQNNNDSAYHLPAALTISGALDQNAVHHAIAKLCQKHKILNARIVERNGRLYQYESSEQVKPLWEKLNLSINDQAALKEFAQEKLTEPFELNDAPLWRIAFYQLRESHHYLLLLNIHHLISDGVSNIILLKDCFAALAGNLEASEINYFDYAHWQSASVSNGLYTPSLNYWADALGQCEPLELQTCNRETAYASKRVSTSPSLSEVAEFAKLNKCTPFAVYLTAWSLVLAKLSGKQRFAVITPDANRRRAELNDCVGFIASSLVLPITLELSFDSRQLLAHIHQSIQQAHLHADVPFELIVEHAQVAQREQLNAMFEAAIHYVDQPIQTHYELNGLAIEYLPQSIEKGKFPLSLNISDVDSGDILIQYNRGLYADEFIAHMAQYYTRVLDQLVGSVKSVAKIELLTETEKKQLLALDEGGASDPVFTAIVDANATAQAWPESDILQAIFRQVQNTPNAIAVSDCESQLCYADLWQQSAKLAAKIEQQCGKEKVIAVALDRSVRVSITLLAILRSGNAYLPLDKLLPNARLKYQVEDSLAALLITESAWGIDDCNIMTLDWDSFDSAAGLDETPHAMPAIAPESLFNLIYTSGSTGTPKGVRVLHQGINNRLRWMQAHYEINASDVVLQKTPLSFDVSVWELFLPLMAGARLHYAPVDSHRDAYALQEHIAEQHITIMHFVPSMLALFVNSQSRADLSSLRLVFCSGEALPTHLAQRASAFIAPASLQNLYGPTEASVDVSYQPLTENVTTDTVPIGRAISNTQLHILDGKLNPVAPFCRGEIVIGGINLAESYHLLPELTAKSFVDNPYYLDGHASARLYRTGDTGRFLADGSIEYLGRNDDQVKLRGLRIELGDVQTHALQWPELEQAAALVVEQAADQVLVLFYVANSTIEKNDLRAHLSLHLPPYSVPNYLVRLDSLPLTPSGKRDNKALKALWLEQTQTPPTTAIASSNAEQVILNIWQGYFPGISISLEDNFFELGGHSLMAGRMIAEIADALQCNVRFADLLAAPNIKALASRISQIEQLEKLPPSLPARIPVSFQQKPLYLFQQLLPESTAYHMPVAFKLSGHLNIPALEKALNHLILQHDILHTVYAEDDEGVFQKPLDSYHFALRFIEQSEKTFTQISAEFAASPFDLQKDLPLRALLVKEAEQQYGLVLVLHHIAGDAQTLAMLGQQLVDSYRQALTAELSLEKAPLQYAHYALWQQQQNRNESLAFWQQQLDKAPDLLPLPLDYPRKAVASFMGQMQVHELSADLAERLKQFCQREQLSPFIVLLSVYQLLLARLAQVDDVSVALPVNGRHLPSLQAMPGYFVNTLIMRGRLQQNLSVSHFLAQVQQSFQAALRHQDIALDEILQQAGRKRQAAYTPIAQVGFNYLQEESALQAITVDGLTITPLNESITSSKSDMSWLFYAHHAGIRCCIEFNDQLFKGETIDRWYGYFTYLLEQAISAPQTPVHLLSHLTVEELAKRFGLKQGETLLPLVPMARDIVIDSLMHPDAARNRIGFYSVVPDQLDKNLWQQSLYALYQHNDLLRSTIVSGNDESGAIAWQLVHAVEPSLPFGIYCVQNHDTPITDAAKEAAVAQCMSAGWDLSQPLWRVHIHQFTDASLVIAGFHHALFDGVSIQWIGRLMKDNYQRLLQQQSLLLPRNDFADWIAPLIAKTDGYAAWQYWQREATNLMPHNLPVTGAYQPLKQYCYGLSESDEQGLKALCKRLRITPALYFKAVFATAARYVHQVQGDVLVFDVVTGRDAKNIDVIGLLFDQQPNVISETAFTAQSQFADVVQNLRDQRKAVAQYTPISLRWQKALFPQSVPFLFNYYIMETASQFLDREELIEHIIPKLDHAVNLVCQVRDGATQLHLYASDTDVHGMSLWQAILQIHQQLLAGVETLGELFQAPDAYTVHVDEVDGVLALINGFGQAAAENVRAKLINADGTIVGFASRIAGRVELLELMSHERETAQAAHTIVSPRNQLEQTLQNVWQEVLGLATVSVEDDFFALGGHSLSAMRIANRLREQYSLHLPLAKVFERPTIAAIAEYLIAHPQTAIHLPAIIKVAARDTWPLSHAQRRLWLLDSIESENNRAAYNVPIALRIRGALDVKALLAALNALWQRHDILRMRILVEGSGEPQWFVDQNHSPDVSLRHLALDECDAKVAAFSSAPFDLAGEPLSRVYFAQIDHDEYLLCINLHHMICDAQSLRILSRDLFLLYQSDSAAQLPKLSLQYQDYAVWQHDLLAGDLLNNQLNYWREELNNAPLLLGLPADKPRQLQRGKAATLVETIDGKTLHALQDIARNNGVSLFMLLLAAYQLVLAKVCQQADVCIGIPRENRPTSQLDNVVGFFINALVVRNNYQSNMSIGDWLAQVRDKTLQAFAHDQIPAEEVLKALSLPRDLHYMPIVQAAFNHLLAENFDALDLAGLQIEPINQELAAAKFELLLTAVESADQLQLQFEYDSELFNEGTIADIARSYSEVLDQLAKHQAQYTAELLLESDSYALTPMQRDLYLASLTRPETLENSIGYALELPIELDINLWQATHQQFSARIAMLRASLDAEKMRFVIGDANDLEQTNGAATIELLDWSNENLTEQDLAEKLRALVQQSYHLPHDKLLKLYLVKLNARRYYTVLACHHLLLDGLSFTLHAYYQVTNYFNALHGRECVWPQDSFKAFIAQSHSRFDRGENIRYWQASLDNVAPLQLGAKGVDSSIKIDSLPVADTHWQAVKKFCKSQRITPALYYKALYSLLIRYYANTTQDFVLFDFNDGRGRQFLQSMGCHYQRQLFIARNEAFAGDFAQLLEAFKTEQKRSSDKQHLSLLAQNRILPKGNASFSYNYLYMPKSGATEGVQFKGNSYSPDFDNNTDLRVQLDNEQLTLSLCYQESLFNAPGFLQRLQSLSEQVLVGISQLDELNYLLAGEPISVEGVPVSAPPLLDAVRAQCAKTPDAIAFIAGNESLSYRQLQHAANGLAAQLIEQGVQKGEHIGILLERNLLLPIALLATMQCGAVYVPMDAQLPAERIRYVVEDAKVKRVISTSALAARLPQGIAVTTFDDWRDITQKEYPVDVAIDGKDCVYMMYTSGTTGLPKASRIRHESFASLIAWYIEEYQFTANDKALVYSSIGFDLSQKNLFALLCCGGTIVLHEDAIYDPAALRNLIKREEITLINCAPSAFYPLLEINSFEELASLRLLLLGGEPPKLSALRQWLLSDDCHADVVNMYGPTECTDIASSKRYTKHKLLSFNNDAPLAIGTPSAGVRLNVLNNHGKPVPEGTVGELVIAGIGVSEGYWQRDALTRERFINAQGEWRFRTGDQVYWNDGNLYYQGRLDDQIKLRGLRIEPVEVARALQKIGMADAQVLACGEQLVGFVKATDIDENWRAALQEYLPQYAVPSRLVRVDAWPLTTNGKIDKAALLALLDQLDEPVELPETPRERQIASLWQEVLGHSVGVNENFFSAGGDSLSAVRVISQLQKQYQLNLPVAALFQAQTIRQLAQLIDAQEQTYSPIVPFNTAGNKTPIFAVHGLGGVSLAYRHLAKTFEADQPFYGIDAYGFMAGQEPFTDLQAMVAFYTDAIIATQPTGSYRLMGHSAGGVLALEIARHLQSLGHKVEQLILIDSYPPISWLSRKMDEAQLMQVFAEHNFGIHIPYLRLKAMPRKKMAALIYQQSQGAMDEAQIERAINVLAGFKAMLADYQLTPLSVPTVLIRAEQANSSWLAAAQGLVGFDKEHLGWQGIVVPLKVVKAPGDHFTVMQLGSSEIKEILKQE